MTWLWNRSSQAPFSAAWDALEIGSATAKFQPSKNEIAGASPAIALNVRHTAD
jgi:hypothetical protein